MSVSYSVIVTSYRVTVQAQLASLPPLDVPKKPTGLASPTGFVKLGECADKDAASREDLAKLSKDTSGLLKVGHQKLNL